MGWDGLNIDKQRQAGEALLYWKQISLQKELLSDVVAKIHQRYVRSQSDRKSLYPLFVPTVSHSGNGKNLKSEPRVLLGH